MDETSNSSAENNSKRKIVSCQHTNEFVRIN